MTICIFLCQPTIVHAQPDGCQDPLDGDCPIDNGVLALLAIGAGYGIKKVVDSRKARAIE